MTAVRSPIDEARLEAETQALQRQIAAAAQEATSGSWLTGAQPDALLNKLMADEKLRLQMLRFVDVLPALRDDHELRRHLDEYLGDELLPVGELPILRNFPGVARWAMRHTRHGLGVHMLAATVRAAANRMAGRFIAGADLSTVSRTLKNLYRDGRAFTLDLLGEATVSEREAIDYQRHYLKLIDEFSPIVAAWPANPLLETISGRRSPRLNLSIKASALCSQLDTVDVDGSVQAVKERLRPIFLAARANGAFINLDMENYDAKEITLRVFRELLDEPSLRDWPDAGVAMQAYLRDTEADIEQMIAWAKSRGTPVSVRLVRGAYWDYETVIAQQNGWLVPVWTHKAETDTCYQRCTRLLLTNHPHIETAIATHNVRSMAYAITLAQHLGLKPTDYEMQMLYGMADPLKQTLVDLGQRLRVYVPFGELLPGMAYLVRRLLENSSSQSFLRMGLAEDETSEPAMSNVKIGPPNASDGSESIITSPNAPFENEPARRFTSPSERESFAAAIEAVRTRLGIEVPLLIGSKPHAGVETLNSINPARPAEIVGRVASAAPAQANDAIAAAHHASAGWADTPAAERAAVLRRTADVMRSRRDELAAWEIFEAGKPWREADADVTEAIDFLDYYADEAERLFLGHHMDAPGETNHYFYEPRGVGAIIAPWNFPLAIVTGMAAAAIGAGNAVVVKPAPQTPVVASKLVEAFTEAGLPPGVLNFLPGPDEVGEALVRHAGVHFVAFTGSEAVGKKINLAGAAVAPGQTHLKRIVAEMGGKNAIIIDSDADLDDAVRGTVASAFGYAGQKCSAASRVIVVGDLHDLFLRRLVEAAQSVRVGLPEDPATFMGPVIDDAAFSRIRRAIAENKSAAKVELETEVRGLGDGYFIGPTIFSNVTPESFLAQEEIFGPVLAIMRARDFDEAITIANGTRFALTGGAYSRSPANLDLARRRFRVGNLYLNRKITGALVGRQPFGGMKMSGVGSKAGGPDYLLQFVEPRVVTENTIRRGFAPEMRDASDNGI